MNLNILVSPHKDLLEKPDRENKGFLKVAETTIKYKLACCNLLVLKHNSNYHGQHKCPTRLSKLCGF